MRLNFANCRVFSAAKENFVCALAFCSRSKPDGIEFKCQSDSFESFKSNKRFIDFKKKMKEIYPAIPMNIVLNDIVGCKDNFYDEGSQKIIYSIPGIDDYLVAKLKKIEACS